MFERFTDRARRVVVLAQEEARMLNHNYIGTEHILLGLIHEGEGVAAKALESLGIALEGVRQQVEEIIGQGQQAPSGHIPFTPRAKKVLELVGRLHDESGRTVVMVLHDLNLAARYADRLVAMKDGAVVASGEPDEVLTEELLADVFDLRARVIPDPVAGTPMVVPIGGRRTGEGAGAQT